MKNVEGEAITIRIAESGVTFAARPNGRTCGMWVFPYSRGGDCPIWLSRIPVQAPDEIEPPFLNGTNDILGTEALNHLGHGEPVPEPLALRIPHDGRSLEERGHDVRPRQNEKYVSPNTRTPTARTACLQVDDDETAKELPDAASLRCVSQKQVRRCSNQVSRHLGIAIKNQRYGDQRSINHSGKETFRHISLRIRRSQRDRQLT